MIVIFFCVVNELKIREYSSLKEFVSIYKSFLIQVKKLSVFPVISAHIEENGRRDKK